MQKLDIYLKIRHTTCMKNDKRSTERFIIYARAEAPDICQIPGILENISQSGCKIRFPLSLNVDFESDYTVKITFSENTKTLPFILICHPERLSEKDGATEVGFSFLRSPDTSRLVAFVQKLAEDDDEYNDIEKFVKEDVCQFV